MAMFLGMLLLPGSAAVFNPTQLQELKTTNRCPNCNLSGADLHHTNVMKANLGGAILGGAILTWARWPDGSKCKGESIGA